jgi:hypothetical protein
VFSTIFGGTAARVTGGVKEEPMIRVVTCGILAGSLWFAALTPARAAVTFPDGISVAASALSDVIVVKKKGVPGWSVKKKWKWHCPPGHRKKGWC